VDTGGGATSRRLLFVVSTPVWMTATAAVPIMTKAANTTTIPLRDGRISDGSCKPAFVVRARRKQIRSAAKSLLESMFRIGGAGLSIGHL
jgi:hypothetical protein